MLYFFSYARADLSPFLLKFYGDLREAVRSKAGENNADAIAFRDAVCIEPGTSWPRAITEALRTCKVFVYLHTPTFYSRDGCGKEFAVVKSRLNLQGLRTRELGTASCIQPIYWDGTKQLQHVARDIAHIQLTHETYGEAYNRDGLLQIVRAFYDSNVYWKAINALAQRIHLASSQAPLPLLQNAPEWGNINPLFPVADARAEPGGAVSSTRTIRPPRYARFIWIVGKRDEMAQSRRAEALEPYDPDIPEEWRPFLPDSNDPARLIGTDAAREVQLTYQYEELPTDHTDLQNRIAQASDNYTPVVVVSDIWSLRLPRYRDLVRIFDRGKLDNCVVVFPWNLKDYDTNREYAQLRRMLAEVFPLQSNKMEPALLLDGVADVASFKAELSKLLTKYIADINRSLKAVRELPEPVTFTTIPQLGLGSVAT